MSVPHALAVVVAAALAGPAVAAGLAGPAVAAGPAGSAPAAAHVLHVGPGQRFARPCQAITAAHAGDTIEIDARGTYRGDVCAWSTNRLTIVGVHGRAHIDAAGANSEGKAIWVIAGNDTTIENVELSGARVPDDNGAGIRQEGAGLTLERCRLDHNQEGILAADNPASDIVIESSTFADNGAGDGFSHNIYINHVRSFTLRDSYSTAAHVGHLVKSRALRNYILYDRLTGERGTDSYELDLPNGGLSYVIGTVLQQGRATQNPNMLAYGEEGQLNPDSHLYVVNDTFVNDLHRGAAILVGPEVRAPVTAQNDINAGSPQFVTQAGPAPAMTAPQPTPVSWMPRATTTPCEPRRPVGTRAGDPVGPRASRWSRGCSSPAWRASRAAPTAGRSPGPSGRPVPDNGPPWR